MSTSAEIVGEEIDKQAALAGDALQDIPGDGASANARQLLARAVLAMIGPYSAAKFFAERVLESTTFDSDLVQTLHSKLLPLERMADEEAQRCPAAGVLRRSRYRGTVSLARSLQRTSEGLHGCVGIHVGPAA
jgi:hypothetical protein